MKNDADIHPTEIADIHIPVLKLAMQDLVHQVAAKRWQPFRGYKIATSEYGRYTLDLFVRPGARWAHLDILDDRRVVGVIVFDLSRKHVDSKAPMHQYRKERVDLISVFREELCLIREAAQKHSEKKKRYA